MLRYMQSCDICSLTRELTPTPGTPVSEKTENEGWWERSGLHICPGCVREMKGIQVEKSSREKHAP